MRGLEVLPASRQVRRSEWLINPDGLGWRAWGFGSHVALKPPSRLRTVLFAYSFVVRNMTASATSFGVANRPRGIESVNCRFWPNEKPETS